MGGIIENMSQKSHSSDTNFISILLEIGQKLNINTDFYKNMLDKALITK